MTKGAEWNDRERQQAKIDRVEVVKNSGRGWRKGDARNETFLIDYKFTEKESFSVALKKFRELQKQAWQENREAVIVPIFDTHDKCLAILDWEVLKEMMRQITALEEEISSILEVMG